jgi:AraC family transcriptional activator of pobA
MARPRNVRRIEFHRTKYGRELLVDVIRAREIPGLDVGGEPHVLAFYEIFLVTWGQGTLRLDGRTHRLSPGSVFFTSPGQPRQWSAQGIDGLCLFFTAEFVEEFFRDPLFLFSLPFFNRADVSTHLRLRPDDALALTERLGAMKREIRKLRSDSPHALRAALYDTLVQISRKFVKKRGNAPASNPTAIRLRRLIERDFAEQHRPAHYARALGVTVGHLNQLARLHLGRGSGAAIRERLSLEARRQLAHTDLTAAEVAFALGFKDPAYFSRFFRRATSVSPTEYRRQRRVRP